MYRFEPGAYKTPEGFLPAIGCYKIITSSSEVFDYVLVNVKTILKTEDHAVEKATESLNNAFKKRKATGKDKTVGESLHKEGYKKVDNPLIAK